MKRLVACGWVVLLPAGCGGEYAARDYATDSAMPQVQQARAAEGNAATLVAAEGGDSSLPAVPDRKIIYEATIDLIVKDFEATDKGIRQLVEKHKGFLADVRVDRIQGENRTGRWVTRIPVEAFSSFLEELESLGLPDSRRQTAQDVTEEFVDLEARIKNKKRLEERILKLVEERAGKIQEVVEVERELGRVREEIERMEGRLRYLRNRTSLTTVTINAREEQDYVPPQAPTFGNRIAEGWGGSLDTMLKTVQAVVLVVVVVIPWLVPPLLVAGLICHRWRRRRAARLAAAQPTPVETILPEE